MDSTGVADTRLTQSFLAMPTDPVIAQLEAELTDAVARLGAARKLKERLQKQRLESHCSDRDRFETDQKIAEVKTMIDGLTERRKGVASQLSQVYSAVRSRGRS